MPAFCPLRHLMLLAATLLVSSADFAVAQDMRVFTTVSDLSRGEQNAPVISHSLTLFHAGKVYDYMEEVGEVVIFEPMHHRFIVLGKDYSATEVPFAVLNHFLESARAEAERYIDQLAATEDAAEARRAASIRFQLQPQFHDVFNATDQRLTMNGGYLNYSVKTAQAESPSVVQQYLAYADWAARLNYVLHPHSTYPEARLKLNECLRKNDVLPVRVDLTLQGEKPVRLQARHAYAWEFQSIDRRHISHWERMLRSDQVRWMTFHEYQQQLLAQKSR